MVETERSSECHCKNSLTTVLEAIPLAILIIDHALKIQWVNTRAESLFDSEAESLTGQSLEHLGGGRTWDTVPDLPGRIRALFKGGQWIWKKDDQFTLLVDGGKTVHHLRINAFPIGFASEHMALMILEDMAPLKEVESLGLTIQKVRATAHDLNQPLSVLMGNLDLLAAHSDLNGPSRKRINKVLESGDRVADVVRRLQMIVHTPKKRENLKAGVIDPEKTLMAV
jgi:nitrogen-specific signal transduction histidine kinase